MMKSNKYEELLQKYSRGIKIGRKKAIIGFFNVFV